MLQEIGSGNRARSDAALNRNGEVLKVEPPQADVVHCAQKYATDPCFLQERQRLTRRIQELETVVETMRFSEMQGVKNRDMTITVYQNKVNELMLRVAEKKFLEEEFREAKQVLAEREEAQHQLERGYRELEQRSSRMEESLNEELSRYQAAAQEFEVHLELAEERHKATVDNLQVQLSSLTQERDNLQEHLFETEEQTRIIATEMQLLKHMQTCLEKSAQNAQPVASRMADANAEGTTSLCNTVMSTVTEAPPFASGCSSGGSVAGAPKPSSSDARPDAPSLQSVPADALRGDVPQWSAPWVSSSAPPSAVSSRSISAVQATGLDRSNR